MAETATATDTTNFNVTRTITLTEHEWLSIHSALRIHAMTQDALGYEATAERARGLARLLEPVESKSGSGS